MDSFSSTSYSSDDHTFASSAAPTTPVSSPSVSALRTEVTNGPYLAPLPGNLEDDLISEEGARDQDDHVEIDPLKIQNICFIGAGYVGAFGTSWL